MSVITCETEVATTISPAKLFKAFVLDGGSIIPKAAPGVIKSVVNLEGDGGPGTIWQINFGDGNQFKYVKERVDAIDKENFSYACTVIEGDALTNAFKKISNEYKIEASTDGGSICKSCSTYYTTGNVKIKEEDIKAGKEKAMGVFKAIEAYILANPDA